MKSLNVPGSAEGVPIYERSRSQEIPNRQTTAKCVRAMATY